MVPTEKRQAGKSGRMRSARMRLILTSHIFIGVLMVLVLYGILTAIVLQIPFLPREYQYSIKDKSFKSYYAPENVSYLDTIATEQAREQAAAGVEDKYRVDIRKTEDIFDSIGNFLKEVETARSSLEEVRNLDEDNLEDYEGPTPREIKNDSVARLEAQIQVLTGVPEYDGPDLMLLLNLDDVEYLRLTAFLNKHLNKLMREPIMAHELKASKAQFRQAIELEDINSSELDLLSFLGSVFIAENAKYDVAATQQARDFERAAIVPIYGNVTKNEEYLKEGDRITQTHFDIWKALGIITEEGEPQRSVVATWMATFLMALVFLVMILYLHRFQWAIVSSLKRLGLLLLVNLITGVSGLLIGLFLFQDGSVAVHLLAVAVVLNALLICQYFSNNLGMFNSILWAGLFAAFFEPAVFFPATLLASLTCLIVRRDPTRKLLILLVLLNILVGYFALAALELFSGGEGIEAFSIPNLWVALIVGIVPVAAVFFLNMLFDLAFNIPTASRLNEFANLNHPLLRKLQIEAPGTYHHSILVGSIAELAGSAIGANPLLIRVGALYHDIGKGQRPEFFAENQYKGSNIHNKYSPSLSKIIIENHVRDGIRLARRARLPKEVIDLIPEHHGTTLITYFFRKALAMSNGEPVNEHDFRYPGPKPQTAEAAVLMMADVSESAARALEEPTPHRIETAVDRLFEERLLDGQFNECSLSMDQLETMKASIISSLVAAYHHRVSYPDEAEMKREIERDEQGEDEQD